jgi:ribose-phosphate pyrophosphokinase
MKLFLNETTKHLRRTLIQRGCDLGEIDFFSFADGEHAFRLLDEVKRTSVTLVASVWSDPATLFDLLGAYRVLRENGSLERTLVIPYLGYARQDRQVAPGEAAIGIMAAELIRNVNASKILAIDVHSTLIKNALGPLSENVSALPLLADAMRREPPEVVVAPDVGAAERARAFAALFDPSPEVAVVEKIRPKPNVAQAKSMRGEVRGKNVVIVDDMIDTGGTIIEAVRLVSDRGAMSIRVAATHGVFSNQARDRLDRLPVKEFYVTNTLPQPRHPRIRVMDVSSLITDRVC